MVWGGWVLYELISISTIAFACTQYAPLIFFYMQVAHNSLEVFGMYSTIDLEKLIVPCYSS